MKRESLNNFSPKLSAFKKRDDSLSYEVPIPVTVTKTLISRKRSTPDTKKISP